MNLPKFFTTVHSLVNKRIIAKIKTCPKTHKRIQTSKLIILLLQISLVFAPKLAHAGFWAIGLLLIAVSRGGGGSWSSNSGPVDPIPQLRSYLKLTHITKDLQLCKSVEQNINSYSGSNYQFKSFIKNHSDLNRLSRKIRQIITQSGYYIDKADKAKIFLGHPKTLKIWHGDCQEVIGSYYNTFYRKENQSMKRAISLKESVRNSRHLQTKLKQLENKCNQGNEFLVCSLNLLKNIYEKLEEPQSILKTYSNFKLKPSKRNQKTGDCADTPSVGYDAKLQRQTRATFIHRLQNCNNPQVLYLGGGLKPVRKKLCLASERLERWHNSNFVKNSVKRRMKIKFAGTWLYNRGAETWFDGPKGEINCDNTYLFKGGYLSCESERNKVFINLRKNRFVLKSELPQDIQMYLDP